MRLTSEERERTVMIDGIEKKYRLGHTASEINPLRK
jgi:hypothetical protein